VSAQLVLDLHLRDGSSFDNFLAAANREALQAVRAIAASERPAVMFVWGEVGSGRTHLLQAACRALQQLERDAAYVPLAAASELSPALLEDREHAAIVCLDDVDAVAGDVAWETAVFALCERVRAAGARLLAAGRAAPRNLGLQLPDLATRLAAGPVYQLQPLTDDDKIEAIRLRARNRGLELSEDVAHYILRRFPRDMNSLFALLDRIDALALSAQRRVTIPLIRALEPSRPGS